MPGVECSDLILDVPSRSIDPADTGITPADFLNETVTVPPELDAMVVPVGGGGLLAGMAVAARARPKAGRVSSMPRPPPASTLISWRTERG